jgi:hypothetical protein
MSKFRLLANLVALVAIAYVRSVFAQDPPSVNVNACLPLSSCDLTNPPQPAPPTTPAAAASSTDSLEQAAHIVDTVTSGTLLVPEAVAHAVHDTAAIDALKGPVGTTLGVITKGAAATTQIYKGYATEGSVGALREGAQVITDFTAEQAIIQGGAAVGGIAFGPPGAEAGEIVGKASTYVGSLIKKLPCGNTNVEGCVTDFEFEVYDRWRTAPPCDENGVCYDPTTGRTNMMPYAPSSPTADDASRRQMEQEFDQLDSTNQAAAAQQPLDSPNPSADGQEPSLLDWLNLAATVPQFAGQVPVQTKQPPPSPVSAIPAGWVPCSCPTKHAGFGRWFNGVLYHPEGPQC